MDGPPVVHGGLDFGELRRLGLDPGDVLDFSSNINPYGVSPAVRAALADEPLDRYPDREALALRAALAESLGVPTGHIIPGNGTSELIWLVALAFVRRDELAFVLGPTYGEYARAAALLGGRVIGMSALEKDDFALNDLTFQAALAGTLKRVVVLCRPNNPTGAVLDLDHLADLVELYPRSLFVVDEAYQPLAAGVESALSLAADNVLVLRSMTKDCGLAGLRLGYAVGPEPLIEALRRVQPPWSVSALAQAVGVAALGDAMHRARSLELLGRAKAELTVGLTRLGLPPLPSAVPFFLIRVGDGAAFRQKLLAHRILVRDCASFGLPAYVRISTRRPEENERLLTAIREVRQR
jgi:threonine-phosphate decarboxylase